MGWEIKRVIDAIGGSMNVECAAFVSGMPISKDLDALREGKQQILAGDPGRVLHLIKDGVINTEAIQLLILDETDQMILVS